MDKTNISSEQTNGKNDKLNLNNKTVWIMNHHATNMYFYEDGRHYKFAENLIKQGYEAIIFCASTRHGFSETLILENNLYSIQEKNNVPFVFVKATEYKGNGISRILNMISFYKNIFHVANEYANKYGKPDTIIASSVHPLTMVAGIKIAKKFGVQCICEIRDLWPESLIAYGLLKKNNPIAKILYKGEKWIYKKADKLIFTMEGGKDYIVEKKWDKDHGGPINVNKIYHINNGVDLIKFNCNKENFQLKDKTLIDANIFKVIYTGSIGLANNMQRIVDAAFEIKRIGIEDVKFIVFGDGNDRARLEKYCKEKGIDNVVFKGFVNKKYIPYILSKSDLNILHFEHNRLKKYGASLNKMFEYFASGKPTIADAEFGYDIINRYECGVAKDIVDPKILAQEILKIKNLDELSYQKYCDNALKAANDYDFKKLTNKLIKVKEGDI